jgi:hypothetical protein
MEKNHEKLLNIERSLSHQRDKMMQSNFCEIVFVTLPIEKSD